MTTDTAWLDARVVGAPPRLAERVRQFVAAASDTAAGERLARAGSAALATAEARGPDRSAALDLLAADALITLALLEVAERAPGDLALTAARLRVRAAEAG